MSYQSIISHLEKSRESGGVEKTMAGEVRVGVGIDNRLSLPEPLRRRSWFMKVYPPVSDERIKKEEESFMTFPNPYKEFLLQANGGSFFNRAITFYGVSVVDKEKGLDIQPLRVVAENIDRLRKLLPGLFIVGGYYEGAGFLITLDEGGKCCVFQRGKEHEPPSYTWPTLNDMFEKEVQRFSPYFDKNGQLMDERATFSPPRFDLPGSEKKLILIDGKLG